MPASDLERRELRALAETLIRKRKQLDERAREIKHNLQRRDDQDSEEAQRLRGALREIQARHGELERESREVTRKLQGHPGPRDREEPKPIGEVQRRIRHLNVAVDNLRAAGMHEMAERLEEKVERLREEHRPRMREDDRPRPRRGGAEGMTPSQRPPRARTDQVVDELRGQMHELRREMDELREIVKDALRRR